jgi:hypothetical protein
MGRGEAHFRGPLCELSAESLPALRKALAQAGIELGAGATPAASRPSARR